MKSKSHHTFKENAGIKFWWEKKWLFYDIEKKVDTLCMKHLKDYKFSTESCIAKTPKSK